MGGYDVYYVPKHCDRAFDKRYLKKPKKTTVNVINLRPFKMLYFLIVNEYFLTKKNFGPFLAFKDW